MVEKDNEKNKLKVHYIGFNEKYDEYIDLDSERLAPMNSHSNIVKSNELILKYKIKGEPIDSHVLFDKQSNTFCHIISDIITDSVETTQK